MGFWQNVVIFWIWFIPDKHPSVLSERNPKRRIKMQLIILTFLRNRLMLGCICKMNNWVGFGIVNFETIIDTLTMRHVDFSLIVYLRSFLYPQNFLQFMVLNFFAVIRGWVVRRCSGDVGLLQFGCKKVLIDSCLAFCSLCNDQVIWIFVLGF